MRLKFQPNAMVRDPAESDTPALIYDTEFNYYPSYPYKVILYGLVTLGICLRIFHFLDNRSLWNDELYLNVTTIRFNFLDFVTQPMAYEQKAPLGYLWAVKIFIILFGKGEKALRLFSLLSGIGALFFFIPVARYFLRPYTVVLAVGIMALGSPFIFHAVEAKQYGVELFAAVLALFFYIKFKSAYRASSLLVWGLSGSVLLFFSYSAIFILASIGLVVSINLLLKNKWYNLFLKLIPFSLWLVSFGLIYYFYLSRYIQSGWLQDFFEVIYHAYMPLTPTSTNELAWFFRTTLLLLEHPLGLLLIFKHPWWSIYSTTEKLLRMPLLPLVCMLLGIFALFKKNKFNLALLLLPILLTLVASGLKLYPFYERFTLFLAPFFIIILALGVESAAAFSPARQNKLTLILVLLLLAPPAWNASQDVVNPNKFYRKEYNKEALLLINDNYKDGDVVYIYWNKFNAYYYYKPVYNLKYNAVGGQDLRHLSTSKEDYYAKILTPNDLIGKKRLWLVYHPTQKNNIGDYVDRTPKWYHDPSFDLGKALVTRVVKLGATPLDSMHYLNLEVKLFSLSNVNATTTSAHFPAKLPLAQK